MIPWWIITTLNDSEANSFSNKDFATLLDHQLLKWNLTSGIMSDADASRWWHIDTFPDHLPVDATDLVGKIEEFLYNPLQSKDGIAKPKVAGTIDATKLRIAVIGDVRQSRTRNFFHCLAQWLRKNYSQIFPAVTLEITGFVFLPQDANQLENKAEIVSFLSELNTLMSNTEIAARPFDRVVFVQDKNASQINPKGYAELSETQIKELFAQILFHLMIDKENNFNYGNEIVRPDYFSIGAGAVFYDWRESRKRLAENLGKAILSDLKSDNESPYSEIKQADTGVFNLRNWLETPSFFRRIAYTPPSFSFDPNVWSQAKDQNDKTVSPWDMHRIDILFIYFETYLRYLPLRLSEYTRLYLASRLNSFREYLENRRRILWEGNDEFQGLHFILQKTVCDVLRGEFGSARSFAQVRLVIERLREDCQLSQLNSQLNAVDEYNQLEVFAIPEELREFYDKAPDISNPDEEKKLYEHITEIIKRHPLPLALFIRAFLLSLMVWFLSGRLLDILVPRVINLNEPLKIAAVIFLTLLPILIAFWQYAVNTLNHLRKSLRRYVAAVLRLAQNRAKSEVENAMHEIGNKGAEYCNQMIDNLNRLEEGLNYPEVEDFTYQETSFHLSLSSGIEIPGHDRIFSFLSKGQPSYTINIEGREVDFSKCNRSQRYTIYLKMLNHSSIGEESNFIEILCPAITENVTKNLLERGNNSVQGFARSLYQKVQSIKIDGWLGSDDEYHRQQIVNLLKTLAASPLLFHSGAGQPQPPLLEWKYDDKEKLEQIITENYTEKILKTNDGAILSLAIYQPFGELGDIATIRAMRDDRELMSYEKQNENPSRVFTVALSNLQNAEGLALINAANGTRFQANHACGEKAAEFKKNVGLEEETGSREF